MKRFLKWSVLTQLALLAIVFVLKMAQVICWHNNFTLIAPPSLESWDPTERVEAARQAIKKFGGKK